MNLAIAFFLILPLLSIASTLGIALGMVLFGVPVHRIDIGFGPRIFGFRIGRNTRVDVQLIYFASTFVTSNPTFDPEDGQITNAMQSRPLWARLLIANSGMILLILLVAVLLGPSGLAEIYSGVRQIYQGTFSPELGERLVAKFDEQVATQGWIWGTGILAAKLAACNLLPHASSVWLQSLGQFLRGNLYQKLSLVAFGISMFVASGWILALIAVAETG